MRSASSIFLVALLILGGAWKARERSPRSAPAETPATAPAPSPPPIIRPKPRALLRPPPTPRPALVLLSVPFTPQAPLGNWADPVYQNGCEEAAVLMAARWAGGRPLTRFDANAAIPRLWEFVRSRYGDFPDLSAADTARLMREYYDMNSVEVFYDIEIEDIRRQLERGRVVIVPANGRLLGNPYYTPPGPLRHMLVIRGYDRAQRQFITNDPGTRRGEGYRYPDQVLLRAVRDYFTGQHRPVAGGRKVMITVGRVG